MGVPWCRLCTLLVWVFTTVSFSGSGYSNVGSATQDRGTKRRWFVPVRIGKTLSEQHVAVMFCEGVAPAFPVWHYPKFEAGN